MSLILILSTLSRHLSPALQAVVDRFVKRQSENGHRIIVADGGGQEFLLGEEERNQAAHLDISIIIISVPSCCYNITRRQIFMFV